MSQLPVNIQEKIKAALAKVKERSVALPGNTINLEAGKFVLPTGQSSDAIEVVLLDWRYYRSYYDKPYAPGSREVPACFGLSHEVIEVPHEAANSKQSESCASCPKNQFGSALVGQGKACREYRLLALTTIKADFDEPFLLRIPPTSLRAVDAAIVQLQTAGLLPFQVTTRLSAKLDGSFTRIAMELGDKTDEAMYGRYLELVEKAQAILDRVPERD